MKLKGILYAILIASIGIGCSDSESPYSNKIKLLTDNNKKIWSTVSIESSEPVEGVNCNADDILTLELFDAKRGAPAFNFAEGFIKCDYSANYNYTRGTWRLNNAQTRIIFTTGAGSTRINYLFDILELTEHKLVLRQRQESLGENVNVTYTTTTYESL